MWVLLLTAARRGHPEGQVAYANEPTLWSQLGLTDDVPGFSADEFFAFTGQLKQTRRTKLGHETNVVLTQWGRWQEAWRRDDERERMSRKRRETRANTLRTQSEQAANALRTASEHVANTNHKETRAREGASMDVGSKVLSEGSVVGSSSNASPLPTKSAKESSARKERKPDPLWDALVEVLHSAPQTSSERGRWNAALRELREADATAADVRTRSLAFQRRYPDAQLTPTALSANWGSLAPAKRTQPEACRECGVGGGRHLEFCPVGIEQEARAR